MFRSVIKQRPAHGLGLVAGLLLAGLFCTTCEFDVGTLDIRLVYEAGATDLFNPNTTTIKELRITVEGDQLHTRKTTFSTESKRSGSLGGLPVGKRVRVTVEGLDRSRVVAYRGMSNELTVMRGTNKIYLFFSQVGAFSAPPAVQEAIAPDWRQRFRTILRPGFGRAFHSATVLDNGTVLIAGGTQTPDPTDHLAFLGAGAALSSAEIFDPTSGALIKDSEFCLDGDEDGWGVTPDCLGFDCNDREGTVHDSCGPGCTDGDGDGYGIGDDCLGPDCNDTVGEGENCAIGECCDDFCPRNGLCMQESRAFHSVLPWRNGQWVVIAGEPGGLSDDDIEYFDEKASVFESASAVVDPGRRRRQAAALVGLDRIVVAGGEYSSELLDDIQATGEDGIFEPLNEKMKEARAGALGVPYGNGALFIGGWSAFAPTLPGARVPSDAIDRVQTDSGELFVDNQPGLVLHHARAGAAAVVYYSSGYVRILVCGGLVEDPDSGLLQASRNCERIKPVDGIVEDLGDVLLQWRWGHTMTLLPDGNVLVAGGFGRTFGFASPGLDSAEIINPQSGSRLRNTIPMSARRGGHSATLMPNGMVLLVGGISSAGAMSSPGYEIYNP